MPWIEKWDGGRVWQDARGKKHYTIRRRVRGRLYEVSTRATTVRGALEALKRFEIEVPASLSLKRERDAPDRDVEEPELCAASVRLLPAYSTGRFILRKSPAKRGSPRTFRRSGSHLIHQMVPSLCASARSSQENASSRSPRHA